MRSKIFSRRSSLVLLTCVVLLCSCAVRTPLTDAEVKAIRKVGVASVLGNTFHGVDIGTTVFNNGSFNADVSAWQIDDFASTELIRRLSGKGTFEVQRVTVADESAVADDPKKQVDALFQAAEKAGIDILVIIEPWHLENYPLLTAGYGLHQRSFFGSARRCVYASIILTVRRVKTREIVASAGGGGNFPCDFSNTDLPYKTTWNDYFDGEKKKAQRQTKAVIASGIEFAAPRLNLFRN